MTQEESCWLAMERRLIQASCPAAHSAHLTIYRLSSNGHRRAPARFCDVPAPPTFQQPCPGLQKMTSLSLHSFSPDSRPIDRQPPIPPPLLTCSESGCPPPAAPQRAGTRPPGGTGGSPRGAGCGTQCCGRPQWRGQSLRGASQGLDEGSEEVCVPMVW